MNQILSFKNSENGRKILMHNVRNLCIFLIIFGVALVAMGSWQLYKNLNKKVDIDEPEIVGRSNSDKTIFSVNSAVGVDKIIYSWNDGEETTIDENGNKCFEFEVNNRIGVNDLKIKAIDIKGNTVVYDNIKIVYDQRLGSGEEDDGLGAPEDGDNNDVVDEETAIANDKTQPTITLTAGSGKVNIIASDNVKMSHVLYSWNGGEEIKVTGLSDDEKTLSAKIDALKGNNKLKVKAYDMAGNCKEIEKDVHGTDGPKIDVKKDDNKLIVKVSDEYGITKIEYNFNNEEKTINKIEGNSYEFTLDLKEGENFIIINAYEGPVKTEYKGKTTYNAQ